MIRTRRAEPRRGIRRGAAGLCYGAAALIFALQVEAALGAADGREGADGGEGAAQPAAAPRVAERVLRLFSTKCLGCHGGDPEDIKSELKLTGRAEALEGGASGEPALVPGDPEASLIYRAVTWRDEDLRMPPRERNRLTKEEVELVRRWILAGARWTAEPERGGPGVTVATSGGQSSEWTQRTYRPEDLWAYRPMRPPEVPESAPGAASAAHPVDRFIENRLQETGLEPGPAADRRTLIRRATLDLTGLPPTPEEVDAFLSSAGPDSFGVVIDRLLASPRYGEQMARTWLDVARYADTAGFSNDFERPQAWRYRDYVIRSFNADKSFDRFVTEQIAGDELDPGDPEMLVAVGFLRMGPWEHTGMSVEAVTRQHYLDDVTNAVGVTFLAQPLRCARCHDHKFDPIPTKDYYRFQAAFAPLQFADREAPFEAWENVNSFAPGKRRTELRLKEAQDFVARLRAKHRAAVQALVDGRGVESVQDLPPLERPKQWFGLSRLEVSLKKVHEKRIQHFSRELARYTATAFSVYNGPTRRYLSNRVVHELPAPEERRGPAQDVRVLAGGSLGAPGEKVEPGVLSAMFGLDDRDRPDGWSRLPRGLHGRRLALAGWIASPRNTLTARVIVNRIWQQHFAGNGIARTPNNFGKMGRRPTHPELLDWLAAWFTENGWSLKKLHRLIMTSATYRRSEGHPQRETLERVDPSNDLLARYPVRRLVAEEIRDALLAFSGELNPEMGGPGIRPEINWAVALEPRHVMGSVAPAYQPSPEKRQRHRRTIYAFRRRTLPDPFLEVFNRPGADTSCERRDETTVTPQAFSLFNSDFVQRRSLALARRLESLAGTSEARVDLAFRLVYGRGAGDTERQLCLEHLREMLAHHRQHRPLPVPLPTKVKRQMVEELTGETFEWDEELDLLEDYERDLMPWEAGPETRALAEVCLVLLNSNEFLYVR